MQHQLKRLMYQTINDILQLEDYACDMAGAAYRCEQDGQPDIANEMRYVAREYRIRALEMRAKLVLLEQQSAQLGKREA